MNITHISLYELEKKIFLVDGDTIVKRFLIIDDKDLFNEGHISQWEVEEYEEEPE